MVMKILAHSTPTLIKAVTVIINLLVIIGVLSHYNGNTVETNCMDGTLVLMKSHLVDLA